MKIGNNDYKTILLDTNAIREIVTNENNSGKGFLEPLPDIHLPYQIHPLHPRFSAPNPLSLPT